MVGFTDDEDELMMAEVPDLLMTLLDRHFRPITQQHVCHRGLTRSS